MAWRVAAAAQLLLGQLSLFPLRLSGADAQVDLVFEVHQPQDKVVVTVGETLSLTCTISGGSYPGPVAWLKGWGSGNETVYDQKGSFPRVTRVVNESNTDFSIHIRDIRPEDTGTYYCVKFCKSVHGDEVFRRGKGTVVSLHGSALVPSMAAAAVVLCFLLGLFIALCMYKRKHRGKAESQCLARPAAMGSFSRIPLRCSVGSPSTPSSKVLDAGTSHLPSQQSIKEDNDIHYADLQPLPVAPQHGRSPSAACSEYASIRVAANAGFAPAAGEAALNRGCSVGGGVSGPGPAPSRPGAKATEAARRRGGRRGSAPLGTGACARPGPRQRPAAEPGPGQKQPTMEPLPHGPGRAAWPLTCLVLLSLHGWPGADAQVGLDFEVHQPQDKVVVTAGETLSLTCTVSRSKYPGPVAWLKGWGSGNETVYDQKGSFPRVTRVVSESSTDFSIRIRDVRPEDTGTYYCVQFRKSVRGDEAFQHGNGTEVSVQAKPTLPVVSGPSHRATAGQSVSVSCTAGGFFPKDISVKWLKDEAPVSAQQPQITPEQTKSTYNMSSTVTITLQKDDVRSQLVCEVQHPTLTVPLKGIYQLSKALRVPPSVHVVADPPSSVEVNKTVNFTCHVKGFYPKDVVVTWLENGTEMKVENISQPVETPQGLFELSSSLVEVNAMEEKNGSVFTCRVVHDAQDTISKMATLRIADPAREQLSDLSTPGNDTFPHIYIVVGVVCTVLALLVAAILYLIWAKQSKGKSSPSARLHEPEKSSEATAQRRNSWCLAQESDPNNLTYADLNFDRERKTIRRMVEMSQQSEYACIQTSQAPASDDLTYADLDMVHLSKAPKRPAPRPEEAGSEYASVQITRK
ncbi:tyrosine-protein phosphatase non-receptor type substrate 1-like [Morus bassanus]